MLDIGRQQPRQELRSRAVVVMPLRDGQSSAATADEPGGWPIRLVGLDVDVRLEPLGERAVVAHEVDAAVCRELIESPDDPRRTSVDAPERMIDARFAVVRMQRPEADPRAAAVLGRCGEHGNRARRALLAPGRVTEFLVTGPREEHTARSTRRSPPLLPSTAPQCRA